MLNRIFVVDSVTLTSTGTAVSSYVPWEQSTRKLPTQVVIKATGQGAYVRLSNDNSAATNADTLVQAGDHVVLSVQGRRWVSVLSDGASSTVNVGALSTGVSGSAVSLDLPFTGVSTLDSRVTFTRASSATFVGSNGLIQSAATNVPRFDYDPVTLAPRGLLIEEQRTNLLTYSEQFDNAAWNKGTGGSIAANTVVAPDGTTTADAYTWASSTTAFAYLSQAISSVSTNPHTYSIWLKRPSGTGSRTIRLAISDITTGTGLSSTFTITESWQRFDFTRTSGVSTGQVGGGLNTGATGTPIAAGEVLEVWGAQLEAGSFATSYIPTVASQVTRSADVASVNTLSPWYNADQSTVYIELQSIWTSGTTGGDRQAWSAVGGTDSRLGILRGSGGSIQFHDETTYRVMPNGTYNDGSIRKVAIGLNDPATSANAAINGTNGTVTTDGTTLDSRITSFRIGAATTGSEVWCGWIRRFTYYPRQLSLAECAAITA